MASYALVATTTWIVFTVAGITAAIHAVLSSRTSEGAIAWAISLVTFPYVSLPCYLIFGRRRFLGYRSALEEALEVHAEQTASIAESLVPFFLDFKGPRADTLRFLEEISNLPFTHGNRAELLVDGEATFRAIVEAIENAQDYVLMQFYIVRDDATSRRVLDALTAAAKRGVKVSFLYDEIGSWLLTSRYLRELRESGVAVSSFRSTKGHHLNIFQLNFRNHRKATIVDGRVGFIGGINLGDEYVVPTRRYGKWRDTHLRITGPAVMSLQLVFLADWYWATRTFLDLQPRPQVPCGEDNVMVLPTGPIYTDERSILFMIEMIDAARHRLWIATPYFVPDPAVLAVIRRAALRHVDVRILLPEKADHFAVWLAAFAYVPELIEDGVRVFSYMPGFMHQKVMLIDDDLASVGTINFDNRSLRLNFEHTAVVQNKAFAASVADMLLEDFARSKRLTIEDLAKRSQLFWFGARLARLFEPVL